MNISPDKTQTAAGSGPTGPATGSDSRPTLATPARYLRLAGFANAHARRQERLRRVFVPAPAGLATAPAD